jgi:2-C-methyl-D-erythritol 4-phosphate cytidylyltransferase/2-C-methyl-D-erythritol 2,4-cyclodiphosphate synthase
MAFEGKTVALLVAAGSGSRASGEIPKQYRRIGRQSVLAHALDHLRHPSVDAVQVVIGPGHETFYHEAIGNRPLPPPVVGGATRQQSVRNGLERLDANRDAGVVLIHDAARPFVPRTVIDRLIGALENEVAAVPILPVPDSLARLDEAIGDPVPREGLVRVQTPQAFRFDAILNAHRSWDGEPAATDDAQVARASGYKVIGIEGDKDLEKLTFPADFAQAEQRLSQSMTPRTGLGFDVHAFTAGDHLWLGGVRIAHERGLAGHSDADVALHALTDAILGALGEGDIGVHFPPSDPQWRTADSAGFVIHAVDIADRRGARISHVDVTLVCETPRIGPYRDAMRERIAGLLRLPVQKVSLKATTTERLGFTGRGEGIAAQAIATLIVPEEP